MRDYAELVKGLRDCSRRNARVCMICGAKASNLCEGTKSKRMFYAADAIEELLAESADLVGQVKRSQEEIRKLDKLLAAVPHWISVEERLPEHYKPVLVTYIGFNSNLLLSDMIAYRDGDGDWCWWDGEFPSGKICKVKITHWMPLPSTEGLK